jgi:hypothetical protein
MKVAQNTCKLDALYCEHCRKLPAERHLEGAVSLQRALRITNFIWTQRAQKQASVFMNPRELRVPQKKSLPLLFELELEQMPVGAVLNAEIRANIHCHSGGE